MTDQKQPSFTFHPAPGYILAKPLTREELSRNNSKLSLPDSAGKEKDSVGIARVIECGKVRVTDIGSEEWEGPKLKAGDLIAYMPFTDAIIMNGFDKQNLVSYRNIMAVATN